MRKDGRKNGYRFLSKILPFMNSVCPWCNQNLDIEGLKTYGNFMENGRRGGVVRVKRKKIDVTIDHKLPIWMGGTNDIENLQLMHEKCNNYKGGRKVGDIINAYPRR